jgi:hypothetical protein
MNCWGYRPMEILVNELSLKGQFRTVDYFFESGLIPFLRILKEMNSNTDFLYKKSNFFEAMVTPHDTICDIYTGDIFRLRDEIRKFKSQLVQLFDNPYWEDSTKQFMNSIYSHDGNNVSHSSLAEACERDRMVASFRHNSFLSKQLMVNKDGQEIEIDNLIEQWQFTRIAYERKHIPFDEYCRRIFSKSKLDFSKIDSREGFSLVKNEEERLFLDGFRKFSELSWQQIFVDEALEYKEYNSRAPFRNIREKIFKFRISRKYRCFGYVKDGVFFVLLFDLEHKLSDIG